VDGSSNSRSCGAGVVLKGPGDILIEQALKFEFKTSNNQAEYKSIIVDLNLALDLDVKRLICKTNSKLMVGQLKKEFQVKEKLLQQYYHLVQGIITNFTEVTIQHIRWEHNTRVDMLSRQATAKRKGPHRSIIHVTLRNPSVSSKECMTSEYNQTG